MTTGLGPTPNEVTGPGTDRLDRRASLVIAVSAAAVGMGASLGFVPGFVASALRDDLSISRGEVGLIVGVHFGCTGLGSVLGGRITERVGARAAIVADMGLVAGGAALIAITGRYWAWLVAAVLAGTGYALANAGTNVAIAASTPIRRRTVAMSIKTAGVPVMATTTAGIGPWMADRWSWEVLVWIVLVVALLVGLATSIVIEAHRPVHHTPTTRRPLPRGFAWFSIAAFLLIAGSQPLYSWLVPYLEEELDAAPALAGSVTSIASAVGVAFMIANGARADRIGPESRIRRMVILLTINAAATALVLAGVALGITIVIVGAIVGTATQLASIGTMHAAVVDRVPDAVARASGATMTGYYLGALLAPFAFGVLADATDTFAWSWLATIILLVLALPAWLIAGRVPIAANAAGPESPVHAPLAHERTTDP